MHMHMRMLCMQVQSPALGPGGAAKLLIPFLDMFNHRAHCKRQSQP